MMDRQTHVEIGHDRMGVIGSGGNAKMQPYYSTFTFGELYHIDLRIGEETIRLQAEEHQADIFGLGIFR